MADTDPGLSVHVKVTVDPSNTEAFLKALEPTFINVKAESLNIFCEVYKDRKNPGVFKLVENWNATLDHMMNVSNVVDSIVSLLSHVFYKVPLQGQDTELQVRDTCTKSRGQQVQTKKDYYAHYRENVEPLFIKPQEVEVFSRMPNSEWASVRKEAYPGRD